MWLKFMRAPSSALILAYKLTLCLCQFVIHLVRVFCCCPSRVANLRWIGSVSLASAKVVQPSNKLFFRLTEAHCHGTGNSCTLCLCCRTGAFCNTAQLCSALPQVQLLPVPWQWASASQKKSQILLGWETMPKRP